MTKPKKKGWSYSAGERGRNRVRAFERAGDGSLFLEWYEGSTEGRRPSVKRTALPSADREKAKAAAERLAAKLRVEARLPARVTALGTLFDNYLEEVSPRKSVGKQQHDARAARLFIECFGRGREAHTLSVRDWDRFVTLRRSGKLRPEAATAKSLGSCVAPLRPVRDQIVAYDLQFLRAVLRWATLAGDGHGGSLLARNPLQGLPLPREEAPRRPTLSETHYQALLRVAPTVGREFELALILAHETGHRGSSIRQLRWADVDLEGGTIRWRAESDKVGFDHTTLITETAKNSLRRERLRCPVAHAVWVFPSAHSATEPCSRHTFMNAWRRAAKLANLPKGERIGYHSLRRKFATELKDAPLRDLCYLGGWKEPTTLLTCYQQPDEATQRRALERRKAVTLGSSNDPNSHHESTPRQAEA